MKIQQWGELDQPPQAQKPPYVNLAHIAARLREVVKLGPENITEAELTAFAESIDYWTTHDR